MRHERRRDVNKIQLVKWQQDISKPSSFKILYGAVYFWLINYKSTFSLGYAHKLHYQLKGGGGDCVKNTGLQNFFDFSQG